MGRMFSRLLQVNMFPQNGVKITMSPYGELFH